MRRALTASLLAVAATVAFAPSASATIHPIVESADCANATADAAHPLGDVADPPGQTPGYGSHSETSTLRAVEEAIDTPAAFGHKLDGQCGHVGN
jgi:hypothetical protein